MKGSRSAWLIAAIIAVAIGPVASPDIEAKPQTRTHEPQAWDAVPRVSEWLPCSSWPTDIGEARLKEMRLLDPAQVDERRISAMPLAIQKIGPDLYRQVYHIVFPFKKPDIDGRTLVEIVTVNNASSDECSMSGVEVYVIGRKASGDSESPNYLPLGAEPEGDANGVALQPQHGLAQEKR